MCVWPITTMDDIITCDSTSNYYEIHVIDKDAVETFGGLAIYNVGLSKQKFDETIEKIKTSKYKSFERQLKEYIHQDLFYEIYDNEIHVYKKAASFLQNKSGFLISGYNKTKQSVVNFPSTTSIFSIRYVKKKISRISNRVFINFEVSMDANDDVTYAIYINYNHDDNVDLVVANRDLANVLKILR